MTLDAVVVAGKDVAKKYASAVAHRRMLLTICREFPGLPDPRTMTVDQIRFFYDDLRPELRKRSQQ